MHPTISWRSTNGLLILVFVLMYLNVARSAGETTTEKDSDSDEATNSTAATNATESSESEEATDSTTTIRSTKVTRPRKTTKKSYRGGGYSNYGQDVAGYGDDDDNGNDNYDSSDRYDNEKPGKRGRSPSRFGQDMADDKKVYDDKDSMMASLDVWITSVNNWEDHGKSKYRGRERENNYKKKNNYKDKDNRRKNDDGDKENDNDRKDKNRNKRSYQRVRFPCRQYQNIRRFPLRRFPPLFSVFPWIPIFYDKITYQTFIFSPTGGIYVLPPLINFYGQRFAVAQLIKWGYASLVSTGVPPPPDFNVAPLVQPAIANSGSSYGPPLGFNANNGQFNGGVTTNFASFRPRSAEIVREDYENASGSDNVESARQQVNA